MRVTLEQIESKIKGETYLVLPDGRTTLCILNLENGYTIKGLSACVDPAEFDLALGRQYARQDAVNQIWPLEGYLLAEKMQLALDKPMPRLPSAKDILAGISKKPHWTQTPEGKKKMAARKRKGRK